MHTSRGENIVYELRCEILVQQIIAQYETTKDKFENMLVSRSQTID